MSTFELMSEGVSSPSAESAFTDYNNLVKANPRRTVIALTRLTLGKVLEKGDENIADTIVKVLDATNHGTQIGLGPNTEAAWGVVFNDKRHELAQHSYIECRFVVDELRRTVERLKKEVEQAEAHNDMATELRTQLAERIELLGYAEAELIERCRERGMHTLRIIAAQSMAIQVPQSVALAA